MQRDIAIPARWNFANETPLPSFAAIDFAAVRGPDGNFVPKVIELQGFPSLYAVRGHAARRVGTYPRGDG
jgi:hypothetical protein